MSNPDLALKLLDKHYTSIAQRWHTCQCESDYASLVTPTGNSSEPFHRWFRFKEAYSHALLQRLIKDANWSPPRHFSVFDPFAGSGTTLVSALEFAHRTGLRASVFGVERNPVMHAVASAKTRAAAAPREAAAALSRALREFWLSYNRFLDEGNLITGSVTLNNRRYFDAADVAALLALGRAASCVEDATARHILSACVAASVEPAGRIRKDGRALRFHPGKVVMPPVEAFCRSLETVLEDIAGSRGLDSSRAAVVLRDARLPFPDELHPQASWAVFSPPYPNNIDYTEVYKVEGWVLGMYAGADDLRLQRLATLRSHPSVLFPERYAFDGGEHARAVNGLIGPILDVIPEDRYRRGREQLIRGYVDDMLRVLTVTRGVMRSDGHAAVIVGNSAHGQGPRQFIVATDLLIAALAELSGWTVAEIRVARRPRRRPDTQGWLRESVVLLRPA